MKTERTLSLENVINTAKSNRIIIIQGLRRIGKTLVMETAAKEKLFAHHKRINLDAMMFGQDNHTIMLDIIEEVKHNENTQYLITVDEFQALNDWNKFFFTLHKYKNAHVIATGSVSANISLINETEGGRYNYIQMEPLSFNEYVDIYDNIGRNEEELFIMFATSGSYPDQEFTLDLTQYKKQVSANILEKIKSVTLLKKAGLDDVQLVNNILMFLIENVGGTLSPNAISTKLKIDVRTVNKAISYLKQTFIIKEIANSFQQKGKAAQNNKKYYLSDSTFYLFVKQLPYDKLDKKYQDKLFENIIINEVKKVMNRFQGEVRFEKIGKIDVDMAIIQNDSKKLFEIKNSTNGSLSENQKNIKNLQIIYHGKTKKIGDKQYINYIEFIKGVEKWI